MRENTLAPSLLSADFTDLKTQINAVKEGGAAYLHLDVMDGMFVPSISFGIPVIKSLRKCTDMVFDVHLMIEDPDRYLEAFRDAGADIICVHAEACKHLDRTLNKIKELGAKAAVALNPATSIDTILHVLPLCDMVLLMSVNPGFGGQKYIDYVTDKICELDEIREYLGLDFDIEIDGGVNAANISKIANAGANIIVAGSAVFNEDVAITKANAAALVEIISNL